MTHRQTLRDQAHHAHGVVTVRAAREAGVPAVEVRKLAARGALERLGQGVYRMVEHPADHLTEFAEAVALVGDDAVLADEAVLAARDLAQVNLRRIRVSTPHKVRHVVPPVVDVVRAEVASDERADIDGVPAMSVARALIGARGRVMTSRLVEAADRAVVLGLLGSDQRDRVVHELSSPVTE